MNGIGYKIKKTILYILLILLSVVCMFPFLLMIVNATRSGSEIMKSFTLIPSVYLKENWATVFKYFNLFLGMWNSLKVAVPSTLLCAYFSAMTAYALAMYKFKGNKVLFMTILIFMMIPGQLGLIGFYNLCTKLHLVNSYIPLIIPAIASPGTVFFLRQYVLSVMPPSLISQLCFYSIFLLCFSNAVLNLLHFFTSQWIELHCNNRSNPSQNRHATE